MAQGKKAAMWLAAEETVSKLGSGRAKSIEARRADRE